MEIVIKHWKEGREGDISVAVVNNNKVLAITDCGHYSSAESFIEVTKKASLAVSNYEMKYPHATKVLR